jgi:hypothetical protein
VRPQTLDSRTRLGACAAGGAGSADLDRVRVDDEAVFRGKTVEPRVELAVAELDDAVAAAADQVMVVRFAAEPVAGFARLVHQRIDDALPAQQRERAVNRRQPHAFPAVA